jgi:hypothetical protein
VNVVEDIMPAGGNSNIKSHNCVRYRSFYHNSRSCGVAKNLWILAQLKHEFYFLVRPLFRKTRLKI